MTRPGIEAGRNATEDRRRTGLPADGGALERPAVVSGCNECNELLYAARVTIGNARRLALVAENALANSDVIRGWAVLGDLRQALLGFDDRGARRRRPTERVR